MINEVSAVHRTLSRRCAAVSRAQKTLCIILRHLAPHRLFNAQPAFPCSSCGFHVPFLCQRLFLFGYLPLTTQPSHFRSPRARAPCLAFSVRRPRPKENDLFILIYIRCHHSDGWTNPTEPTDSLRMSAAFAPINTHDGLPRTSIHPRARSHIDHRARGGQRPAPTRPDPSARRCDHSPFHEARQLLTRRAGRHRHSP